MESDDAFRSSPVQGYAHADAAEADPDERADTQATDCKLKQIRT